MSDASAVQKFFLEEVQLGENCLTQGKVNLIKEKFRISCPTEIKWQDILQLGKVHIARFIGKRQVSTIRGL